MKFLNLNRHLRSFFTFIICVLLTGLVRGQKEFFVSFDYNYLENIPIENRMFFIEDVKDQRIDKSSMGTIKKGLGKKEHIVKMEDGIENAFNRYYRKALQPKSGQIPIVINVRHIEISETETAILSSIIDMILDYSYKNNVIFSDTLRQYLTDKYTSYLHDHNLANTLSLSAENFDRSDWEGKITDPEHIASLKKMQALIPPKKESTNEKPKEEEPPKSRNVTAIGYQIGGYSLIGFNQEMRVNNVIGVHLGAGILGFTAGIKLHLSPSINSPFFNFSYKDGGIREITAAAVEYGGRIPFGKEINFGLHYQIGIAKILHVSSTFENLVFQGNAPPAMLSMGIGFSW